MATITGTGITDDGTPARLIKVALAVYSVVVFATLAGSLGAFFLDKEQKRATEPAGDVISRAGGSPGSDRRGTGPATAR